MKTTVTSLVLVLLFLLPVPQAVAQTGPAGRCRVSTTLLSAAGTVQSRALPYFIEVELTVVNKTAGRLRLDPGRFLLIPDQGRPVTPASPDQVIYTLRSPSPTYVDLFGVFWSGSFALGVGVGPIDLQARAIEGKMLKPGDLAPGASVRGSLYFRPAAWPAQFTLSLDGLTFESGAGVPPVELRDCQMPHRPSQPPVVLSPAPFAMRTVSVNGRGDAGPVALRVSSVEFARDATTLAVSVENSADVPADFFVAIGDARLIDNAGKTYAVRMLRSSLPDRIASHGQSQGTLVFEPLPHPPAVSSAVLLMPGVSVAGQAYDVRIDLQF
jgi:hypothetical protein